MSLFANRASAALRLLAQDPVELGLRVGAKLRPQWAWQRYARHCRHQGLARSAVVLSLDCDTHKDIVVAREVHDRLGSIGFCPVYAVPGDLLRAGADTYASIAATGATFLNHGYVEHTRLEEASNEYVSTVFYDRMDPGAVRDDVRRGHAVVSEVIGRPPVGFRTPHFGSYARPAQLAVLYEVLSELGYRFSSSTPPINALRHGPVRAHGPIVEVPVTGCPDWPAGILDSYGFRFAPGRSVGPDDYVDQARKLAALVSDADPLFVNLYADPSQIHDWPGFFEAMERLAPWASPSYEAALGL